MCNEEKAKQLVRFCPQTSVSSSHQVNISCQIKSPEEVRDSFCTMHPFLSTQAWEGLHTQSKKEKRITRHLSSQWLPTPVHLSEHPHKPQHWGWAAFNQRGSSTGGKYVHTQTFYLYLHTQI